MKIKSIIATLSVVIALTSFNVYAGESFDETLKTAKEAQEKAASVDGEWRDVQADIKKAEEANKEGDAKAAMKLAGIARDEAEIGYEQAVEESKKPVEFPAYMK